MSEIVQNSNIMGHNLKLVFQMVHSWTCQQQGFPLRKYFIPGCVGRGVRLGSESSSVVVGGVWKSGNLEIWDFGNLEIWGPGNPEILRFGDLEIQNFGIQEIKKTISKFKSVLPKMSARSGLVGNKSSRPYLGPSEAIFSMDRKNPKNARILPIFPVWALAAIHPGWGNR